MHYVPDTVHVLYIYYLTYITFEYKVINNKQEQRFVQCLLNQGRLKPVGVLPGKWN